MSWTTHYEQATKQERLAAALEDVKFYLGDAYPRTLQSLRDYWQENSRCSVVSRYREGRMVMANIVGIQGKTPYGALLRAALKPATLAPERKPHLTLILTGSMRVIDMDNAHDDLEDAN